MNYLTQAVVKLHDAQAVLSQLEETVKLELGEYLFCHVNTLHLSRAALPMFQEFVDEHNLSVTERFWVDSDDKPKTKILVRYLDVEVFVYGNGWFNINGEVVSDVDM